MQKEIISIGSHTIVNVSKCEGYIYNYKSGINFFSAISESNNTSRIIVNKEVFTDNFFNINNKLLERVLLALMQNELYIAIVGDFSEYNEKTLDFLYNYNRNKEIFFLSNVEEAIFALNN